MKGQTEYGKKLSPLSLAYFDVLGSSRDLQVYSTKFALKKQKPKTKTKTIFWPLKDLNSAERIDLILFNKFPCHKHLSANRQPEFYYTHKSRLKLSRGQF